MTETEIHLSASQLVKHKPKPRVPRTEPKPLPESGDVVWGAPAIARVINASPRMTYHWLETGQLPAKKQGGRWAASRRKLLEHFE